MDAPSLCEDRTTFSRRLAVSALSGMCFSLLLRAIIHFCFYLVILFVPGIIGSFLIVGFPPCGPMPPEDHSRDWVLVVATILNGMFYGGIFFSAICVWAERKMKRRRQQQTPAFCCELSPEKQLKSVGSLLDYGLQNIEGVHLTDSLMNSERVSR